MRILLLVTKRQYRGAEVFAAELGAMLAENGHDVLFTGLYAPGENVLSAKGTTNIDLDGTKKGFSFSLLMKLLRLVKKTKPDILQANGSDTLKYAVFAKLFYPRLNIVYRNISMVSAWTRTSSSKRKFYHWLFKKVNRVSSVGKESMEDFIKTYNYPSERTKVIRRGVPQFHFDRNICREKIAQEFGFDTANKILVHIGQFSPEKNHAFLVESFEILLRRLPMTKLLFVGEGKMQEDIVRLINQKKLGENIFFAGHRDNVQEVLAGCDLFILGSAIEGVPGVVLEAGMQSIPAVAVNVGGVGEVVKKDQTGILLEKHDPQEFSNAMESLLKNDITRTLLGVNAKNFVLENYSLHKCRDQFEYLYKNILQEN